MKRDAFFTATALSLAAFLAAPALAQNAADASTHSAPWPNLGSGQTPQEVSQSLDQSPELNRNHSARDLLDQRRRLDRGLAALEPQRRGTVDAFVVSVALDSDPVFSREAREVGRVLARRYGAEGRTLVMAAPEDTDDGLARGSISNLLIALASVAEKMDTSEDVLVLYTTSHGAQQGLAYHYGDDGYGILSPSILKSALEELGVEKRLLLISACFSGIFVPALATDDTAILTASADNRTSFGCQADNDWTFFGDALINRAFRKPQPLVMAHREAMLSIADWESRLRVPASLPQARIGNAAAEWLSAIEANIPQEATAPVGKPALNQ